MIKENRAYEIGRTCGLEFIDQKDICELTEDDYLDNAFDTAIEYFRDKNGYLAPNIRDAVYAGFESVTGRR